jgi:hypothetical protein
MVKGKAANSDLQNTTQKTKDRATRTKLKPCVYQLCRYHDYLFSISIICRYHDYLFSISIICQYHDYLFSISIICRYHDYLFSISIICNVWYSNLSR